ncbi:MAG: ribosomal-protein-alanine N-acetyltransferase [Gammaproteobacteria bacterium]|nr:ribosomal-protein-alanine N-acetyltransferase [Gammaproteobacteria bacterium]
MRTEDLDAVVANEFTSYAFPWTRGIFMDCLKARHECWVAWVEDEIVAHAVLSVAGGEAHLLNLCVRRDCQGCGYGRILALHMVTRAHERGAGMIFLEVRPSNLVAANLYDSLGFNEIGIRNNYYPTDVGHEDARVLALDLTAYFDDDPA